MELSRHQVAVVKITEDIRSKLRVEAQGRGYIQEYVYCSFLEKQRAYGVSLYPECIRRIPLYPSTTSLPDTTWTNSIKEFQNKNLYVYIKANLCVHVPYTNMLFLTNLNDICYTYVFKWGLDPSVKEKKSDHYLFLFLIPFHNLMLLKYHFFSSLCLNYIFWCRTLTITITP